jgi:6-phosphogluconolactonase
MATRTLTKGNAEIRVYHDGGELAAEAARYFARIADKYVLENGSFAVALSGGSTPRKMFELLAQEPFLSSMPWSSIYFFWGDERCVPPDHPDSNYRMACEALLSKAPVPPEHVYRIPAEMDDPDMAAEIYERQILKELGRCGEHYLSSGRREEGVSVKKMPCFDLILLGMGADGHTASLFPRTAALGARDRIVVANYVEKFNAYRITLTPDAINNARGVTFVVAGDDKAEALKTVLEGERRPEDYPSQLIRPRDGKLLWMIDEAAARLLKQDG